MTRRAASEIRLSDAIAELRAELSKARQEGQGKDVRFATKSIEVELSLDFGWSAEGEGGVSQWIPFVDLSAKGGVNEKSLHKIKLTLEIDTQGDPSKGLINDTSGPAPVKRSP